jgi:hypothetical protein
MTELSAFEKFKAKCEAYAQAIKPATTVCWLFHRWGRWQRQVKHFKRFMADRQWHEADELWQNRSCSRCGFTEERKI